MPRRQCPVGPAGFGDSGGKTPMPPPAITFCPVTELAPSEARKATTSATSRAVPSLPKGIWADICSIMVASVSGDAPDLDQIGVWMAPGLTALTRIRRGASSAASEGIIASKAPRLPAVTLPPGTPRVAPTPTVNTTEAPSASRGRTFCKVKNCPLALIAKSSSYVASSTDDTGAGRVIPAFRKSPASWPNRVRACSARRSLSGRDREWPAG